MEKLNCRGHRLIQKPAWQGRGLWWSVRRTERWLHYRGLSGSTGSCLWILLPGESLSASSHTGLSPDTHGCAGRELLWHWILGRLSLEEDAIVMETGKIMHARSSKSTFSLMYFGCTHHNIEYLLFLSLKSLWSFIILSYLSCLFSTFNSRASPV